MEFGKRRDATDTTDFCPRQLVADLSFRPMLPMKRLAIRGNWCNGFWH